ncbi:hypothetical protein IE81DRAFT_331948 [Ceraceosorus guamensis]|uniref:Uncharacterized protein n=1 Tax=Ceraceosorus guamensis TaxID=1522189 RepID=A0A316VQQ2_9BASI|nr:hypothetical protein IE81DRAFT_331948 [Ceraceosorus guamensis]PWN39979.1 hypothetical protein IE81DRAFT_331948 [Ceraceosorus guamensis]
MGTHLNDHIPLLPALPGVKNKGQHKNLQEGKKRKVDAAPTDAYKEICLIWGYEVSPWADANAHAICHNIILTDGNNVIVQRIGHTPYDHWAAHKRDLQKMAKLCSRLDTISNVEGMRAELVQLVCNNWEHHEMGSLQYGPDSRIHCWLHSPQILCALYNLARDPLGFDPASNLWPCFQLDCNGQHYICKDLLPLSNERLVEHEKKCLWDKPWTLLLRGREGFIKYAGTVHHNFDGNGPAARNKEDNARLTAATTRLSRWATGKWSLYALVNEFPDSTVLEWQHSSAEQDAEQFSSASLVPSPPTPKKVDCISNSAP